MKVLHKNQQVCFRTGLSSYILKESRDIDIRNIESNIVHNYGINANFENCKPISFCVQKSLVIFNLLRHKTNAKLFNLSIPIIRAYESKDLLFNHQGYGFCLPDAKIVLKDEPEFEAGSIFYKKEDSLEKINQDIEYGFREQNRSSSHYLANTIHELLHNSFINSIFPKRLDFKKLQSLQDLTLSPIENNIVKENIGSYSIAPVNQYHEIFAETFTQLICNSLSEKDSLPVKNPLEDLNKYPQEFLKILMKILNI